MFPIAPEPLVPEVSMLSYSETDQQHGQVEGVQELPQRDDRAVPHTVAAGARLFHRHAVFLLERHLFAEARLDPGHELLAMLHRVDHAALLGPLRGVGSVVDPLLDLFRRDAPAVGDTPMLPCSPRTGSPRGALAGAVRGDVGPVAAGCRVTEAP